MATNYGSLAQEMIDAGLPPALAKLIANAIANAATPQFTIGSDRVDATPTEKLRLVTADTRRYELTNLDFSPSAPFDERLSTPRGGYEPAATDHPYKDSQPVNVSPTLAQPAVVGSDYINVERSVNGETAVNTVKLNLRAVGGRHLRLDSATKTLDSVPLSAVSQTPKFLTAEVDESPAATEVRVGVRAIEQVNAVLSDGSTKPMVAWPAGPATANGAFTSYAKNTLLNATNNGELQRAIGSPVAWVNFNGDTAANVSGTYSRTGTTVTVTLANHGHLVNHWVYLDFTSGAATDGFFQVASVASDGNSFTITHTVSGTTSGNVTLLRRTVRASNNVHSVSYRNVAGSYAVNFATLLADTNYCVVGSGRFDTGGQNQWSPTIGIVRTADAMTTAATRIGSTYTSLSGSTITPIGFDSDVICVAFFR